MAATTFATWYAAFRDLSVTGVTNLAEPPLDVPSAKRSFVLLRRVLHA